MLSPLSQTSADVAVESYDAIVPSGLRLSQKAIRLVEERTGGESRLKGEEEEFAEYMRSAGEHWRQS